LSTCNNFFYRGQTDYIFCSLGSTASTPVGEFVPWTRNFLTYKQPLGRLPNPKPAKEYRVPNSTPVPGMKHNTVELHVRKPVFKYTKSNSEQQHKTHSRLFPNIDVVRESQVNTIEYDKTEDNPTSENEVPKPSEEPVLDKSATRHSKPTSTRDRCHWTSSMKRARPRPAQILKLPTTTLSTRTKVVAQPRPSKCPLECILPLPIDQASAREKRHPKEEVHPERQTQKNDTFYW